MEEHVLAVAGDGFRGAKEIFEVWEILQRTANTGFVNHSDEPLRGSARPFGRAFTKPALAKLYFRSRPPKTLQIGSNRRPLRKASSGRHAPTAVLRAGRHAATRRIQQVRYFSFRQVIPLHEFGTAIRLSHYRKPLPRKRQIKRSWFTF